MNMQTLMNFGLATVIVFLLFYIRSTADEPVVRPSWDTFEPGNPTCKYDQINGFAPGISIDKNTSHLQAEAFKAFAERNDNTMLGGVISKATIDSLFCGGSYNGLAYRLAMDTEGRNGPASAIFVIVGGVNVQDVNNTPTIISQSPNYFRYNMWCPTGCLSFE